MGIVDKAIRLPENSIGFDTEAEMMNYIQAENVTSKAGIVFNLRNQSNVLAITLRLYSDTPWLTESLWPDPNYGVRNWEQAGGGYPPGYYERGFVWLQNAIFTALNGDPGVTISLKRLPVKGFTLDSFVDILGYLAAPLIIFAYFMTFTNVVKVSVGSFCKV